MSEHESDGPASLDLYHRTSIESARQIYRSGSMITKENRDAVFFSTHPDENIAGYGEAVVHIRIPADWIEKQWIQIDDEFELGDGKWEEHYVVQVHRLRPEHFIASP